MNLFLRQTSMGQSRRSQFNSSPTKSISNPNISQTQGKVSKINPEQQQSTLQQNDDLFKVLVFDNGNAVKDCKAILETMKEEFLQEKEKLSLFYQDELTQLLDSVGMKDINIQKILQQKIGKQINTKIKNIKIKKHNEVFQNYSKLLRHSLRQNQKVKFINESSKITNQQRFRTQIYEQSSQTKRKIFLPKDSQTILQKMMQQKRQKMALENSSKLHQEQKDLQQMMKNRQVCEKILEEALMFERYYDILKKEKQQNMRKFERATKSVLKMVSNKSINKTCRNPLRLQKGKQNMAIKYNPTQKNMSIDPRHLRLPQTGSKTFHTQNFSQQYHERNKYMAKLKRDEYIKQINKVNQDIIDKKNAKNNILIDSVLSWIRTCSNFIDQNDGAAIGARNSKRRESVSVRKDSVKRGKNTKPKSISGPGLTRLLRRLFLIYSFQLTQDAVAADQQCLMSQKNLMTFLHDFQIDYSQMSHKNELIRQILQKERIDQFQFIQFIHLLSATAHQSYYFDKETESSGEGMIYTNINMWVRKKILSQQYTSHMLIEEERMIRDLRKDVEKLRKFHRIQTKLQNVIQLFLRSENINRLRVPTLFKDFDYLLEVLWYVQIYPTHINKRTIKFYFEYLKQEANQHLLEDSGVITKKRQFVIVENVLWLTVAKMTIADLAGGVKINKEESIQNIDSDNHLEQLFTKNFRLIDKLITKPIEVQARRKHTD